MLVGMKAPWPVRFLWSSASLARMMMPEERSLASRALANMRPWVSLPDMGRPKMLIEPVPSQDLIVAILFSIV